MLQFSEFLIFHEVLINSSNDLKLQYKKMSENSKIDLVYFNCRGTGHYYRYILYQIGVPFQLVYVGFDGKTQQYFQQNNISLADIPCLVVDGKVIKQIYTAMRFLCTKYHRQQLLGESLHEQIRISQIFNKYSKKRAGSLAVLLKYIPKILKQPDSVLKLKQEMIKQIVDNPGAWQGCSMLYSKTGNYLFDHLTIADFLFYENCFYFVNLFGDVCRRTLQLPFAFKNFFERTQFYKKHKQKIENFKFIVPEFDKSINQGFKLMWLDKKYLI